MSSPYTVAVVLETEFGESLFEIAARMPVWIVDTPRNRAAAERHWAEHPELPHTLGVTTFKVDRAAPAEDWLADVLSSLDLHHGEYSHDPPYGAIEVFGATLTMGLRGAFAEFGLDELVERPGGFVAKRRG
jgi:hypothetical protein